MAHIQNGISQQQEHFMCLARSIVVFRNTLKNLEKEAKALMNKTFTDFMRENRKSMRITRKKQRGTYKERIIPFLVECFNCKKVARMHMTIEEFHLNNQKCDCGYPLTIYNIQIT